ncbi:MAG TPA: T9SS type A sorting domain-containing protein [Flavobacteriales bacterium]|nr:T9SS type A sorting domain-containing protein [Flavobacteriales bacterium]
MRITITPLVLSVLLSVFIPFSKANAQTLIAPSFLSGDSYTMGVLELSEAGEVGENMVWDYSTFLTVNSYNAQILSSSPSSFEDDYPYANWMLEAGGAQYYYNYGPDVFEYFGGVEGGASYPYNDSEIYFPYPFSYGETWTDTFDNVLNIAGFETHRSGIVSSVVDGYGTLDLPGGVHLDDVTRISLSREITDSSMTGEVTYLIDVAMFYSGTTVVPMVTHTHLQVIEVQDTSIQDYTEILQSYLVEIDELQNEATEINFTMFPNPASSKVQFVFAGGINAPHSTDVIEIRDISGRLIETLNLVPGVNSGAIDVSSWAKGVYTATSKLGLENVSTKQLIVE